LDIEEREQDLEENLINYINVRKELSKQCVSNDLSCGEEYLWEKKR
jgi:hypothetical protein